MKTGIVNPSDNFIYVYLDDVVSPDYGLIDSLNELLNERRELYSALCFREIKNGSDRSEYSEQLDDVRANRAKIDELLPEFRVGSPLYNAIGDSSALDDDARDFVIRQSGIFYVDSRFTSDISDITEEEREYLIGTLTRFVFDEIHGREVVEGINNFLATVSNKPLRKFLIRKKNEIIEKHPEVENWNLGKSFLGSEEFANEFRPESLPLVPYLAGVSSQVLEASKDYWQLIATQEREELISSMESDDKFEQVYAAICLSSVCPHLDEKTNQEIVTSIQSSAMYNYMDVQARTLMLCKEGN